MKPSRGGRGWGILPLCGGRRRCGDVTPSGDAFWLLSLAARGLRLRLRLALRVAGDVAPECGRFGERLRDRWWAGVFAAAAAPSPVGTAKLIRGTAHSAAATDVSARGHQHSGGLPHDRGTRWQRGSGVPARAASPDSQTRLRAKRSLSLELCAISRFAHTIAHKRQHEMRH